MPRLLGKPVEDTNTAYYAFEPEESDILMAIADYGNDMVTSLAGEWGEHNGIQYGYASG